MIDGTSVGVAAGVAAADVAAGVVAVADGVPDGGVAVVFDSDQLLLYDGSSFVHLFLYGGK